ncbi:branched-chain amino acid transport system II carrier protein [Ectobacillus sp. SYSU M60031]|uniref:Branched-chain amino acid transport system carrier protein n=1 Tax=Ectobacillus ponti TaxID=2961894 RepID=A0AA41XBY4_9BACI|nr:branched-chain amino acid transport system II carrier protein [Ectobacillus ponti]
MKKKDTLLVGLMLFSMFFGAGNLIFPPFLGMQAGHAFWPAITGFILTGVGLPLLVLAAAAAARDGAQSLGNRVHPIFGLVFTIVVYVSIGPFFGIPRNANVAFEMGLKPLLGSGAAGSPWPLLLFTVVFFALVLFVSLNPVKMVDYMGKWITPALLLAIVVLCAFGALQDQNSLQEPADAYAAAPLLRGFIDGYSTMDALAALAFGIVILTTLSQKGVQGRRELTKFTLQAGLVAGAALAAVYIGIGWLGAHTVLQAPAENGTALLAGAASHLFGRNGTVLLGFIFTLACFTTCVGLTIACSQYFVKLTGKVSYRTMAYSLTLLSFLVANLGLNQIISISVPFLVMAYPLTIVLVLLSFLPVSRMVYGSAMLLTGLSALYDGLGMLGLHLPVLQKAASLLPFAAYGLGWVTPAAAGALLGLVCEKAFGGKREEPQRKAA